MGIAIGGLTLLMLMGLAVVLYRRPRARARRTLRRLGREPHRAALENRSACLQIHYWLRKGLRQPRLQAVEWPPEDQAAWLEYLDRLAQGCFAPAPPSAAELAGLINEARRWLQRKTLAR
jgi:hypothetical protein